MTTPPLNPTKIALIIPTYLSGGTEKISDIIFGALIRDHNFEVELITTLTNNLSRQRAAEIGYTLRDLSPLGLNFGSDEANTAIIERIIAGGARNVVFAGIFPGQPGRYRRELPGRKLIFHLHTMPLWQPTVRLEAGRRAATSRPALAKWYVAKYLREKALHTFRRRYARQLREVYANVDSMIVLAESYRRRISEIINAPAPKVTAISNPFDPGRLLPLASAPKADEIIYLGRLQAIEKGVDKLLLAWKRIAPLHPLWRLKLVGDGPDEEFLKQMVKNQAIPRVDFCGFASDVASRLASASILCLPSNIEGWPTVLLEAMAAGVVPVAFGCSDGVREMLADGRGIVVEPGNVKELANALSALIDSPSDRSRRQRLYPPYVSSFPAQNAANSYLKLLNANE